MIESLTSKVNSTTGYINYNRLEKKDLDFRPKLIICGGSAHPRDWNYERFRAVADKCGALLLCDRAHISGLVAAQSLVNLLLVERSGILRIWGGLKFDNLLLYFYVLYLGFLECS
ncbi:hypothetical protein TIFTF001_053076 [Ficus carica]|uniref:Serine hydroxymethyltransferase-like domain-containing protein n=1 Tax=Ficus carica TaxID=3494 RepID=A0AA88JGL6_FICCA|nr:hypothetical protein TIFTF001_053076 [Ficus carica]